MLKILLTGPTDRLNRGTEALVLSRITILNSFFESSVFFIPYLNLYSIPDSDHEIVPYKRIGLIFPTFLSLKTPFIILSAIIWSFLSHIKDLKFILDWNEGLNILKNSDIVLTTGGDVLSEDYGIFSFLTELCGLCLAILLGKPFFVFAESVGPFKTRLTSLMARTILNKASLITTRDEISFNYLKEIGVNRPPVYFTADSAFVLDRRRVNNPSLEEFLKRDNIIGFSISNAISEFGGGDYDDYAKLMVNIIDKLIGDYDANVLLVAHVTVEGLNDDRIINEKVFEMVKNRDHVFNLKEDYNAEELKYVISKCDLFVGARMHANIAALSSCVPAVAISYSIKTPGLMKLCGVEDYYIEFEDLSEELLMCKIADAWENREKIRGHLKETIPLIKDRAMRNGELVKRICDSMGIS
jgi:colanic acid/amylovoran biosynthesis protein